MDKTIPWDMLAKEARAAAKHAYVPYSRFAVGAAILTAEGKIVRGCNVENASYGLTNCAERTAIFTAKADGSNLFACDSIISNCQKSISAQLGGAKLVDSPAPVSKLSAPSWWLLILSAVALITFYFDIVKGVS